MLEIISRKEAKKQGLNKYFTGIPCKKGHVDFRYVGNYNCHSCELEHGRRYYYANTQKAIAKTRKWKAKNPEKVKIQDQKKYLRRADKVCAKSKIWKKNNPEALVRQTQNRRARKNNAPGTYTQEEIKQIFYDQFESCAGCSRRFSEQLKYTIDHIIPLSREGSNWSSNIQLLCGSCNYSKGPKLMDEWLLFQKLKEAIRQ